MRREIAGSLFCLVTGTVVVIIGLIASQQHKVGSGTFMRGIDLSYLFYGMLAGSAFNLAGLSLVNRLPQEGKAHFFLWSLNLILPLVTVAVIFMLIALRLMSHQ